MSLTRPTRLNQVRALAPAFFSRFFETEITAGTTDLRASIFYLIAFLAAPGFAAPMLIGLGSSPTIEGPAGWGWNMVATHQGVEALRALSLSDKTFYIGCSMAAAGLISAVVWNSLLTDRRDALVLGVLPVSAPTIVLSKLVALSAFIAMVVAGMHLLASASFGLFLGSANTFTFILRGMAAHFIASCAASAFVVFAVAGTQGAGLALLGPRLFAQVTPILQLALVTLTIVGLCLLPRLSHAAASVMLTTNAADLRALAAPPLWFVGAYESVLGTPSALMHRLSTVAFSALGYAVLLTVASYAVAYRRLMNAAVEITPRSRLRLDLPRFAAAVTSRDAEVRAIVHFFVCTLTRLERQRFVLASAIGAGLAWGLPGWIVMARGVPQQPPAPVLAVAFSVMLAVLVAFRLAAALPAEPKASWAFDFSLASWRTTRRGLERAMLVLGVAPVVMVSGAVYIFWWGATTALVHLAFSSAVGFALVQLMLGGLRGMPCAEPWTPRVASLRAMWPIYLGFFLAVTAGMPSLESLLVRHPVAAGLVTTQLVFTGLLLRLVALRRGAVDPDAVQTSIVEGVPIEWRRSSQGTRDDGSGPVEGLRAAKGLSHTTSQLFARYGSQPWLDAFVQLARDLRPRPINLRREVRQLGRDVTTAVRHLRRRAAFTVFSVVTIAFGVAATATVYAVAYDALLKPPAIKDIDRVVNVYNSAPTRGSFSIISMSWPDYRDLRVMQSSYSQLAAWSPLRDVMSSPAGARVAAVEAVGGEFFSIIGRSPALGRLIQPDDDEVGAPPVLVLSHAFWQRQFASDRGVIGTTIRFGGRAFEVVGVAAPEFAGVSMPNVQPTSGWIPLSTHPFFGTARNQTDRDDHWLFAKGRLAPGVTVNVASTEMREIARQLDRAYPINPSDARYRRYWQAVPAADIHLHESVSSAVMPLSTVLVGAVVLVLLVTCTNLANLTLAWGASRQQDLAVRLALGASRRQVVQGQIVESMLIAVAGGAAAYWLARAFVAYLGGVSLRLLPGLVAEISPTLTGSGLPLMVAVTLAIVVSGVWPAWRLARVELRETLAGGSRAIAAGGRGRQVIIAGQVAASVVLLGAAALFLGDMATRSAHNTGIDLDRLAVIQLTFADDLEGRGGVDASVERVSDRLKRQPGIASLAVASGLPMGNSPGSVRLQVPGAAATTSAASVASTSSFFDTVGIRLLAGRPFSDEAGAGQVVLSERTAREVFGSIDAVGRTLLVRAMTSRVRIDSPMTVVGVAANTDVGGIGKRDRNLIYLPLHDRQEWAVTIIARTAGDPAALAGTLQSVIRPVDPDVAVVEATTGAIASGADSQSSKLLAMLAGILGVVALGLAMVGLFGVLSQQVSDRTRELGVRTALGAQRADLVRLVMHDGVRPVLEGLALGLALAILLRYSLPDALAPLIPAANWMMLLAVPALLLIAAVCACYWPARRATATDAMTALRTL